MNEFILKLVCEYSAENKLKTPLNLILRSIPQLGRKSLNNDPWYTGLIQTPFIHIKYEDDCKQLYLGHLRHSLTQPAIEYSNDKTSCKYWCKLGRYHRVGGPAVEWSLGLEWWHDGSLHRVDGPAIERTNGTKMES